MNSQLDEIRIDKPNLLSPLRYVLIVTVVISAYDVGRAILSFIDLVRQPDMDVLLVLLWLLAAPLTFAASVFLFYACKCMMDGKNSSMPITVGFGLMILSSVSGLISQVNILHGEGLSIVILCGLVLVCYIIIFLQYQRIGSRPLTIFAAIMNVLCGGYYLVNGIKLVINEPNQLLGYLFTSYATAFLIALSVLLFVLTVDYGPIIEEIDGDDLNSMID
ncbi:MAG: hypothetical protein IKQ97_01230 [Eubacterium sp.]|nr:hypothetical protein [Eubacterium sp.]